MQRFPVGAYSVNPSQAARQIPNRVSIAASRIIDRRRGAIVLAAAAGLLSVVSVLYVVIVVPSPDFELDPAHREVLWVLPGGDSWESGIRPKQAVVRLAQGEAAGEWELITTGPDGRAYGADSNGQLRSLRATLPAALTAIAMWLTSVFLLVGRSRLSAVLALLALGLAAVPVAASNQLAMSTATFALGPSLGAAWIASERRMAHRRWALATALAVVTMWLIARLWVPDAYAVTEAVRVGVFGALIAIAALYAIPWNAWLSASARFDPSLAADFGALILVVAVAVIAVALGASVWFVAPITLAMLAVYPRIRRRLGSAIEHLVFGSIRDHAAVAASEDERARLASEIHDGPLQELAAVIGELDEQPLAESAASVLRDVAAQLRSVTTALRPPVLDDLGLGAAVAWLVEQTAHRVGHDVGVECDIDDMTRVRRSERPPPDVELATFRIVQEALGNALRHADAGQIAVTGRISPDLVALRVGDDGRGIDDGVMREARRAGRLGIPSMQQRADSIDADLTIGSGPAGGTSVSLRWSRT